jgi:signal transduction histidine kinase
VQVTRLQVARWSGLAAPRRVDLVVAAVLLVWGLPDVPWWWRPPGHGGGTLDVLSSLALTLAISVPFYWRRRFPVVILGAAGAVLAIRGALGRNEMSAFAALLAAAYGLGAYGGAARRYARWLGWMSLTAAVTVAVVNYHYDRLDAIPFALLGAAFVLGEAAGARRGESHARRRESAAAVEAAHQAERTRIARELHDVVAHQLSAIAVQAGAARLAATAQRPDSTAAQPPDSTAQRPDSTAQPPAGAEPAQSPAAVLSAIEQLSREALAELNHLLGALRREPEADPERRPTPALSDLPLLLDARAAAGAPADLVIEGTAIPLSPGVELSAYRIIQEALANTARHAPAASARVTVRYGTAELGIEVTNAPCPLTGRAGERAGERPGERAGAPGGRGIRGMRERAELYGGHLAASATPDGGFSVTGILPYNGPA